MRPSQDETSKEAKVEVRDWQSGHRGKTAKGDFIVLRATPRGYLVQYTSGEWEGKFIQMPRAVGKQTHTMEGLKLSLEDKEAFLDLFYDIYPEAFNNTFYEGITTSKMVTYLRDDYPAPFEMVLQKFYGGKRGPQ